MMRYLESLADPVAFTFVVVAGIVLLFFGGRLLRPAVLLGALVASGALGVRLAVAEANVGILGVPPAVWAIGVPIAGAALALVLYRLCLGILFSLAAASAGFLMTVSVVTIVGMGPVSEAAEGTPETAPATQAESPAPTAASQAETPVIERIQDLARSAASENSTVLVTSSLKEIGRSLSVHIDEGVASASGWLASQSVMLSASLRTLGLAVATVCGLIGLALGLSWPERVSRVATAIVGGWLLVAAGSAIWVQASAGASPPLSIALFLAWGVLAGVGITVQSRQKSAATDEKR